MRTLAPACSYAPQSAPGCRVGLSLQHALRSCAAGPDHSDGSSDDSDDDDDDYGDPAGPESVRRRLLAAHGKVSKRLIREGVCGQSTASAHEEPLPISTDPIVPAELSVLTQRCAAVLGRLVRWRCAVRTMPKPHMLRAPPSH